MFRIAVHVALALALVMPPGLMPGCGCAAEQRGAASAGFETAERTCCGQGKCAGCGGRSYCKPVDRPLDDQPTGGEQACCRRTAAKALPSDGVGRPAETRSTCGCLPASTTTATPSGRWKASAEELSRQPDAAPRCLVFRTGKPPVIFAYVHLDRRRSSSTALEKCVELGRLLI